MLTGSVVSDCDEFNAARGLLLVSVFFLALGLLFQLCAAMRSWVKGTTVFAFSFTLLGSLCGLVSMALYATLRDEEERLVMAGASYSLSFVLLSVGWPLSLLSSLVFCPFTD
jgi:Kef-type K+ transport system membrane component KefB